MITSSNNILKDLEALMTGQWLSDLSNFCSLLYHHLPDVNWLGFYLDDRESLKLGPFQGKIACTDIAYNRGVCGAAFTRKEIVVVEDVHQFPGHIACDSASNSEIVLPLTLAGRTFGVLDVDSPKIARFGVQDQQLLSEALGILFKHHPDLPEKIARAFA